LIGPKSAPDKFGFPCNENVPLATWNYPLPWFLPSAHVFYDVFIGLFGAK